MWITFLGCIFGLANGVRHAVEPDHLAAVSTLVAHQKSARDSMRFAATWGLGHGLVLLLVGGGLLALRTHMPYAIEEGFELAVGVMLVFLGTRTLQLAWRHHGHVHAQAPSRARPLVIGVVHGLAGSGALAALATTRAPSLAAGLLFLGLYAAGAMAGMAGLAGLAGLPIARLLKSERAGRGLLAATGAMSLLMGLGWGTLAAIRIAG
jgi:hypothetical protein